MTAQAVERIPAPPLDELRARYLDPGVPVILTDVVTGWPAAGTWTPEHLAREVGDRLVPVVAMRGGDYAHADIVKMPLRSYLVRIGAIEGESSTDDATPGVTYYLAQAAIAAHLPELLADIETPAFFPDEEFRTSVIYVGGTLFSQLHYHPKGSATLCMLYGTKKVRLFAPDQTPYLYRYPAHSPTPNVSRTQEKDPDPAHFPDFAKARFTEVTVSAGEMLFIPIYWWHSIENVGLSISTVFFWSTSWRSRFLPPEGLRGPYVHEAVRKPMALPRRAVGKLGRLVGKRR